MKKEVTLYVDQWGGKVYARTLKELREQCGGGRVFKIYCDTKDGKTNHVGYGVGQRWFTMYKRVVVAVS